MVTGSPLIMDSHAVAVQRLRRSLQNSWDSRIPLNTALQSSLVSRRRRSLIKLVFCFAVLTGKRPVTHYVRCVTREGRPIYPIGDRSVQGLWVRPLTGRCLMLSSVRVYGSHTHNPWFAPLHYSTYLCGEGCGASKLAPGAPTSANLIKTLHTEACLHNRSNHRSNSLVNIIIRHTLLPTILTLTRNGLLPMNTQYKDIRSLLFPQSPRQSSRNHPQTTLFGTTYLLPNIVYIVIRRTAPPAATQRNTVISSSPFSTRSYEV